MNSFHKYRINMGEEALRNGMATYSSWFKKDVGLITDTMVLNKVFGNQYAT